jgi:hypothetical protein
MTKLDQDRYLAGKQLAHAAASVPIRPVGTLVRWVYGRGVSVDVGAIPQAVAQALGLVATGYRPGASPEDEAIPTEWMKPQESSRPDEVLVAFKSPSRRASVAADGTAMPEGACDADRWDGLRAIVARECDVDDRRGEGGVRYYAEKYPAFVRMAEREMEGKQRAAALAASHGIGRLSVLPEEHGGGADWQAC